jgi:hypothetical protein
MTMSECTARLNDSVSNQEFTLQYKCCDLISAVTLNAIKATAMVSRVKQVLNVNVNVKSPQQKMEEKKKTHLHFSATL